MMDSNETHDFDGYKIYPLNQRRPMVERLDLQYLHSELERTSPLLFVDNSNDCEVGVVEAISVASDPHLSISKKSAGIRDEDGCSQQKIMSTCISSLRELHDVLRVSRPVLISAESDYIISERVANRQYKTYVSVDLWSSPSALSYHAVILIEH